MPGLHQLEHVVGVIGPLLRDHVVEHDLGGLVESELGAFDAVGEDTEQKGSSIGLRNGGT